MITRQRSVLWIIKNFGRDIEKIRLVKLAFLVSWEMADCQQSSLYSFVPYLYGPFSFTLYHEMDALKQNGWIVEDKSSYRINSDPSQEIKLLPKDFEYRLYQTLKPYLRMDADELTSFIYKKFPWFTIKSVKRRASLIRPIAKPRIYTIGYEKLMVDRFLNLLMKAGIWRIIDVRANPVARRYGFHKKTLNSLCSKLDIDYIHFPKLGIPGSWRAEIGDKTRLKELFEKYTKEILTENSSEVQKIAQLMIDTPSAIMCLEEDPTLCHRSYLGRQVAAMTELPHREIRGRYENRVQYNPSVNHSIDIPPSLPGIY